MEALLNGSSIQTDIKYRKFIDIKTNLTAWRPEETSDPLKARNLLCVSSRDIHLISDSFPATLNENHILQRQSSKPIYLFLQTNLLAFLCQSSIFK